MPFAFSARVSHTAKQITSGKIGLLMLALGCVAPFAAKAAPGECMASYYKEKSLACVDESLAFFRSLGPNPEPQKRAHMANPIGFIAGVFLTSEPETQRILGQDATPYMKDVFFRALLHAGKVDEAKQLAAWLGVKDTEGLVAKVQVKTLDQVKPATDPAENDLLIGAYMATGNAAYITSILENYSSADNQMIRDAMRMGFLSIQKAKPYLERGSVKTLMQTLCERYSCKTDPQQIRRLATMGTAVWALQSLGAKDEGIKNAFVSYANTNARFRLALQEEQAAFNNYRTLLSLYSATKDNAELYANLNESLSLYEKLAPAADTLKPMMNQPPKKL